jgi:DNA-binding beta-propeller fold protein YncE
MAARSDCVGSNSPPTMPTSTPTTGVPEMSTSISSSFSCYATIAYDASTGAVRWVRRYDGPAGIGDLAESVAVNPDGSAVYVSGFSAGTITFFDYATLAYDASTGVVRWVSRYDGPGNATDQPSSVATSPDGSSVYVTGESAGANFDYDYATIAYEA